MREVNPKTYMKIEKILKRHTCDCAKEKILRLLPFNSSLFVNVLDLMSSSYFLIIK